MTPQQVAVCVSSHHHTIRPHHIVLLTVIEKLFSSRENELPSDFVLHAYRILLQEIAEVAKPRSHEDLMVALRGWRGKGDRNGVSKWLDMLRMKYKELRPMEVLNDFMRRKHSPASRDRTSDALAARRSIFGFFCRRIWVSFMKLSSTGAVRLQRAYLAWCSSGATDGYENHDKTFFSNNSTLLFKTPDDVRAYAIPDPMEAAERGLIAGEVMTTTEQLHQFFNQRFHDANQSGLRQHDALANARAHFLRGEYGTCRRYLADCIPLARTVGDKLTLQAALGLQRRLPSNDENDRPPLNDVQPHLHPFEILADVKKLLNEQHGQPLSISFRRIVEAMALFDQWIEQHKEYFIPAEQWGPHAVQSVVWDAAGCASLSALEEQTVLAFTNIGDTDNNRITVFLNKAYKMARQGKYTEALALLLEPSVWRGLAMHDYTAWVHEIWHILTLRATRRHVDALGQMHMYYDFLIPRAPERFNPRHYITKAPAAKRKTKILDNLLHVFAMRAVDQASYTMENLLTALWYTEFLGHMSFHRPGTMLLADISLEFEMARRSRRMMEEIIPQASGDVINGDDIEQRAFACFTLARCIIAEGKQAKQAILDALRWLPAAEQDYKTLGMYQSQMDVQYLISVLYHNLDMIAERDAAAERHAETAREFKEQEDVLVDSETEEVLDVVAAIGAALAAR
ncbi:hypothetical protein HDZ31DRAFT_39837 [Schizophyllum fasciatum]